VADIVKEGWYQDPAGRHEYRWFSQGVPTDLVMDAHATSRDGAGIVQDPAVYASMDLARPPDDGPLLQTGEFDQEHPSHTEFIVYGSGAVRTFEVPDEPS
jgi:hypothetical protein